MSLWKRLFGVEEELDEPPLDIVEAPPTAPPELPDGPIARLQVIAQDPRTLPREEELIRLLQEAEAKGRIARALDLLRRVLVQQPALAQIRLEVADALSARGDDAGAELILQPILARRGSGPDGPVAPGDVPLRALMLAAEIVERRGAVDEALGLYEQVLARDVDYPRARERVLRLREERKPRRELAGATLLTDGALARGRYRVQRELGRGGAGTVFAARDEQMGRLVALKVYHRRGRVERERLLVEARVPARLEHPGVVRVFDLDEALGAIAMEWVRGGSVRRELERGTVSRERLLRWFRTALDALAFVHQNGFVHRDIKPSNLLLRADDRVVLTDFGLAARIGEEVPLRGGAGEGTLAYMPQEQRAGAAAAESQDIHAFGATLREVVHHAHGDNDTLVELAEACTRAEPHDRPTLASLIRAFEER
ncbi:MAG: protein kinase [Myxococcota bacterium]